MVYSFFVFFYCRTSHEVRELKSLTTDDLEAIRGRTSHEVRELKSIEIQFDTCGIMSHLTRGA